MLRLTELTRALMALVDRYLGGGLRGPRRCEYRRHQAAVSRVNGRSNVRKHNGGKR